MVWEFTECPADCHQRQWEDLNLLVLQCTERDAPAKAGLPQIPSELLPADHRPGWANGNSSMIGCGNQHPRRSEMAAPQLLAKGMEHSEVRFAWCQKEDLHVLITTPDEKGLYHLAYSPSTQRWSKLCVLEHSGLEFCVQNGTVHLADFDSDAHRVCYRPFDGKAWSKASWFDAKGDYDGLAIAADNAGAGHVVWGEEDGTVAHAVVKDGKAECSRQSFADRPIHPHSMGEFAIVGAARRHSANGLSCGFV